MNGFQSVGDSMGKALAWGREIRHGACPQGLLSPVGWGGGQAGKLLMTVKRSGLEERQLQRAQGARRGLRALLYRE